MLKLILSLVLAAACFGQTIRTSGSNVDRTDAEWAAIAGKKTGTAAEQAQYAMFQDYINLFCPASTVVSAAKQGCHTQMAMAYKLDPVTYGGAFADKACALLKYYVDRQDGDSGGYLDTDAELNSTDYFRWGGPTVASSWAVLKDHCNSYDTTVRDRVLETVARAWEILKPDSTYPQGRFAILKTPYQVNGNSGIGQVLAMTKLAIATYEPSTFTAPQTTWLPTIVSSLMTPYVIPCLTNSTAASTIETCYGGSWGEGMSEYGPESIKMMVELIDAWRIGTTDVDYWPSLSGIFPEKAAEWMIRGTSPTGVAGTYYTLYQPFLYRDVQEKSGQYYGFLYFPNRQMMNRIQTHLARIGSTTLASYVQWWLKNIQPVYYMHNAPSSQTRPFAYDVMMYDDPNSAGTDYRSVMSTGDSTPYMLLDRSSWSANATWVGVFAMREGGSHQHGDSGSFNIYRNGKWLTRERPGYFQVRDVNPSHLHNTLTLNGHGSKAGIRGNLNDTGFARMQRRTGGWMTVSNDTYAAAEMDLSPAYRFDAYLVSPDVTTVTRNFFYLKPDIFIVADRIKYLTGVSGYSIAHIQSEKGPASVSGKLATISNGPQRLHVTKLYPSTANFLTVQESTCKVLEVRIRSNDSAAMFTDCSAMGNNGATYSVTLSGGQGAYTALNGTHTVLNQLGNSGLEPFADGGGISTSQAANGYSAERFILNSTGLFTGLPAYDPSVHGYLTTNLTRNVQWNDPDINPTSVGLLVTHDPYRLDIHIGRKNNQDAILFAMQGADSTDTPIDFTTLTSTTSNATGTSFTPPGGSLTEVMAPTLTTPTFPMSITRSGDPATHYWLGLTPGTTYYVSDSASVTTVSTSAGGTAVVANNAGIITYSVDSSVQSPQITLVATPASLSASCVNGGSNPADQNVALTVTGDGGEASISLSDDSAAISESLSGGAAPQTTPQTMTVAFGGCSGLSVGVHNFTISVTSGTTYVVNSPLTIPVQVTVTAAPIVAVSPASLAFTATETGANPADKTTTVTLGTSGNFSVTSDSAWLTVLPTSATGTTSQDLTVSVDIAGLSAGNYSGALTVTAAGYAGSPLTIPVTLAINLPIVVGIEPRVGTTTATVPYYAPDRAAYTIRACTDVSCNTVVATKTDDGGAQHRITTVRGLTPDTDYYLQLTMGSDIRGRLIHTLATGGGATSIPFSIPLQRGAVGATLYYGTDESFGTSVEMDCGSGTCSTTVNWPDVNVAITYKIVFVDAGDNPMEPAKIQVLKKLQ